MDRPAGHAFISYVREDSHDVDRLQLKLEAAGVSVWRDTADLWPGENWRMKIRHAITDDAFAFIACFSSRSVARRKSYQNEELLLAIEQLRQRLPDDIWLIPVRLDDCDIPDLDLGGGQTLGSIQRVDLFDDKRDIGIARLVTAVLRILGRGHDRQSALQTGPASSSPLFSYTELAPAIGLTNIDIFRPARETNDESIADLKTRFSTIGDPLPPVYGHDSKILEINLPPGRYLVRWSKRGDKLLWVRDRTEEGAVSWMGERHISYGEEVIDVTKSGPHLLRVQAEDLDWSFDFTPI